MIAFLRRGFFAVLALSLVLGANVRPIEAQSQESSRYAAIVIDAATGEVLFARHADSHRYPASLTKMMTLYLTFEALSQGKANLNDVLTISPRAASQPPSKLGLAAGQTITLDNAMRATAVRSAAPKKSKKKTVTKKVKKKKSKKSAERAKETAMA